MKREVLPARTSVVAPLLVTLGFLLAATLTERHVIDRSKDLDCWGRPFRRYYRNSQYVLHSLGLDGVPYTTDDIWSYP